MVIIPIAPYPSFTEQVTIENVVYNLRFDFNSRGEYWVLTFSDTDGNILLDGIKIVLDFELIERFPGHDLPEGNLFAIDTTGTFETVGYDELINGDIQIVYMTREEKEDLERAGSSAIV